MSQLLISVLTVLGILIMMLWISPLLALIAILTVPAAIVVTAQIAKRSKPHFVDQWRHTGVLNAQIEEAYTGHELVKAFGRSSEVEAAFDETNEQLYQVSYRAQFISGLIMPMIMFLGNVNYVLVAVVGGLRVANGQLSLGEVQAFIQYSRQFTQPLTQIGVDGEPAAVGGRVGGAGVRGARRRRAVARSRPRAPPPTPTVATSCSTMSRSATAPTSR